MRPIIITLLLTFMLSGFCYGQDTLYMQTIVQRAIQYYPTITKANEAIMQADARAEASKAVWRPQLAITGVYTWISPERKSVV